MTTISQERAMRALAQWLDIHAAYNNEFSRWGISVYDYRTTPDAVNPGLIRFEVEEAQLSVKEFTPQQVILGRAVFSWIDAGNIDRVMSYIRSTIGQYEGGL